MFPLGVSRLFFFCFFFQAEDGIRDLYVTGDQTCALPIYFDARPAGATPELLVVHGISLPPGEFGGPWIDRLFTNALPSDVHPYFKEIEGLVASAHALIRRDGQIAQYVPFGERAWHAGKSDYQGRSGCNDFSVGIELEGADGTPYSE